MSTKSEVGLLVINLVGAASITRAAMGGKNEKGRERERKCKREHGRKEA